MLYLENGIHSLYKGKPKPLRAGPWGASLPRLQDPAGNFVRKCHSLAIPRQPSSGRNAICALCLSADHKPLTEKQLRCLASPGIVISPRIRRSRFPKLHSSTRFLCNAGRGRPCCKAICKETGGGCQTAPQQAPGLPRTGIDCGPCILAADPFDVPGIIHPSREGGRRSLRMAGCPAEASGRSRSRKDLSG